ncbi:MAG: polyprenyl diphosphate synthase [Thermoplasmata archaeon]|nr:polyprenyl diphosphate synthase [Thermoplasmata archaeon]MCI4341572.1 polyprenyl diphosphate synthase [Thermoplasmata archaeon]
MAIIMDGNRRFARNAGMLIEEGHLEGKRKLEQLLDWCLEIGLKVLTVYAFSTENLRREPEEVNRLLRLFTDSFRDIADDERVHRHRIRVRAIGNRSVLPPELVHMIERAEERTAQYDSYLYNVAIGYGGREEIVHAIQEIAQEVREGKITPDQIDLARVSAHLYTADLPDPDFVLRTSGEERISNFLLWQTAYSELYFSDVYWPGFTKIDFLRAIHSFQARQRRYGK